jgi:hypothetical protein
MYYYTSKQLREFEDKIGFEVIMAKNIEIGRFLAFEPEIEYCVSANGSYCYSPDNTYFPTPESQKQECDRWLAEQNVRFPDGWVTKEGYQTTRHERYPPFHHQWEHLVEAIRRLKEKGRTVAIDTSSIFNTWELVVDAIISPDQSAQPSNSQLEECDHPKAQLEDYHDSSIYCNKCSSVIEQNGKRLEKPSKLYVKSWT